MCETRLCAALWQADEEYKSFSCNADNICVEQDQITNGNKESQVSTSSDSEDT